MNDWAIIPPRWLSPAYAGWCVLGGRIPGVPRVALHPRLYSAARIRGLGFGAFVWRTNLGVDKLLMVELLARLCVDKIGRFYSRYARKWGKNKEQKTKALISKALKSPRSYYNTKTDFDVTGGRRTDVTDGGAAVERKVAPRAAAHHART